MRKGLKILLGLLITIAVLWVIGSAIWANLSADVQKRADEFNARYAECVREAIDSCPPGEMDRCRIQAGGCPY